MSGNCIALSEVSTEHQTLFLVLGICSFSRGCSAAATADSAPSGKVLKTRRGTLQYIPCIVPLRVVGDRRPHGFFQSRATAIRAPCGGCGTVMAAIPDRAQVKAAKLVSESARERETFE